ncbi:hypothetical protein BGZ83_005541 [Gryganskiella cystojenkinii]|nr:hypothetical protein BGZ83_005541 [Gryganskiella cystojenkinii]
MSPPLMFVDDLQLKLDQNEVLPEETESVKTKAEIYERDLDDLFPPAFFQRMTFNLTRERRVTLRRRQEEQRRLEEEVRVEEERIARVSEANTV